MFNLIKWYLFFYSYYLCLKTFFFSYACPRLFIVYDAKTRTNETYKYYLGLKQQAKTYYVVVISDSSVNRTLVHGSWADIKNVIIKDRTVMRKDVALFYKDEVVAVDLNVVDDFYVQTYDMKDKLTKFSDVCKLLKINCDKVQINNFLPLFKSKDYDPEKIDLGKLFVL